MQPLLTRLFNQIFLLQDRFRQRDIPKGIFVFALIIYGTYSRVNHDI